MLVEPQYYVKPSGQSISETKEKTLQQSSCKTSRISQFHVRTPPILQIPCQKAGMYGVFIGPNLMKTIHPTFRLKLRCLLAVLPPAPPASASWASCRTACTVCACATSGQEIRRSRQACTTTIDPLKLEHSAHDASALSAVCTGMYVKQKPGSRENRELPKSRVPSLSLYVKQRPGSMVHGAQHKPAISNICQAGAARTLLSRVCCTQAHTENTQGTHTARYTPQAHTQTHTYTHHLSYSSSVHSPEQGVLRSGTHKSHTGYTHSAVNPSPTTHLSYVSSVHCPGPPPQAMRTICRTGAQCTAQATRPKPYAPSVIQQQRTLSRAGFARLQAPLFWGLRD
eukprot:1155474-Pelagomonas_calceolata.AAC.5